MAADPCVNQLVVGDTTIVLDLLLLRHQNSNSTMTTTTRINKVRENIHQMAGIRQQRESEDFVAQNSY